MREVARVSSAVGAIPLVPATASDACVRVAYEADAPIHAKLVDEAGRVLGESGPPAVEGVVTEEGPVCVRKGDRIVAVAERVAEGGAAQVRWMAWQAP